MWQPDSSIHEVTPIINYLSTILVYYIYIYVLCIGFVTWCSSKKQCVSLKTSLCAARRGAWRFAPLARHSAPQSLGHGDLDLTSHRSKKHVSFLNAEYRIVYAYVSKSISIIYIYIHTFIFNCLSLNLVLALMSWNQVHQRLPDIQKTYDSINFCLLCSIQYQQTQTASLQTVAVMQEMLCQRPWDQISGGSQAPLQGSLCRHDCFNGAELRVGKGEKPAACGLQCFQDFCTVPRSGATEEANEPISTTSVVIEDNHTNPVHAFLLDLWGRCSLSLLQRRPMRACLSLLKGMHGGIDCKWTVYLYIYIYIYIYSIYIYICLSILYVYIYMHMFVHV